MAGVRVHRPLLGGSLCGGVHVLWFLCGLVLVVVGVCKPCFVDRCLLFL